MQDDSFSLISDLLDYTIGQLLIENTAVVSYLSGSVPITGSGYVSYSSGVRYETDPYGNKSHYVDAHLLLSLKEHDKSVFKPLKTLIYVNGNRYYAGNYIESNPIFINIALTREV